MRVECGCTVQCAALRGAGVAAAHPSALPCSVAVCCPLLSLLQLRVQSDGAFTAGGRSRRPRACRPGARVHGMLVSDSQVCHVDAAAACDCQCGVARGLSVRSAWGRAGHALQGWAVPIAHSSSVGSHQNSCSGSSPTCSGRAQQAILGPNSAVTVVLVSERRCAGTAHSPTLSLPPGRPLGVARVR